MEKSLRKLKKLELLEIVLAQSKEIENLRLKVSSLEEALSDRKIRIDNSGSLAEASLKVTRIFEEAQKAADLYLENIKDGGRD